MFLIAMHGANQPQQAHSPHNLPGLLTGIYLALAFTWCRAVCRVLCAACLQAGFAASGHPAVRAELDLVEDEDQITHEMSLEDKHDPQV